MTRPSRMTFVTCLLAAPILFGIFPALLIFAGDYASRFAYVGNLCLLVSLPAWLFVFPFFAWRVAKRGETGARPYVFTAMGANAASLVIYPVILLIAEMLGADLSGMLRQSFDEAKAATIEQAVTVAEGAASAASDIPIEELSLLSAAMLTGFITFFVGLFVMPVLGALFGWVAGKLGLVRAA